MKKIVKNLEEMDKFAEDFVSGLVKNGIKIQKATIIGLYGDLGAGKTAFTKGVAKAFGLKQAITSPTFVIEKIYKIKPFLLPLAGGCRERVEFEHLIHIDAYRLESGEEMKHLGWEEILNNPKNLILIEWPEKIEEILPKDIQKVYFKFIDDSKREIEY